MSGIFHSIGTQYSQRLRVWKISTLYRCMGNSFTNSTQKQRQLLRPLNNLEKQILQKNRETTDSTDWPFQGGASFVNLFTHLSFVFDCHTVLSVTLSYCLVYYLQTCGLLLGKGWPLGFLVCDVFLVFLSLFHMVSCVSCGNWLCRFLIFAFFITSRMRLCYSHVTKYFFRRSIRDPSL